MSRPLGVFAVLPTLVLTVPFARAAEEAVLTTPDADAADAFGLTVAISGDLAVVGAYLDEAGAPDSGSAFVFARVGTSWLQMQRLSAADPQIGHAFGLSVAVSGDTAVIGARNDDDGGLGAGAAYVFVRNGVVWSQMQKLVAADAASADAFGWSVAISGDVAVIGSPYDADSGFGSGSAYVFERVGTVWTQAQKLLAEDGAVEDQFGRAVAVSDETVLVSAESHQHGRGAAYVFTREAGVWGQRQKLMASDAASFDHFGLSVGLSGDTAIVGSPGNDDAGSLSGSAYVFQSTGTLWSQTRKLAVAGVTAGDQTGFAVAVSGGHAVVGQRREGDPSDPGGAWPFLRAGATWTQQGELDRQVDVPGDYFGFSVSVSGDTALVGSVSGAAYVFRLDSEPGVASCFGVGCPCTNDDPSAGCASSMGTGGLLLGNGTPSVSADDLVFAATGLPPHQSGLFFMGNLAVVTPLYDGLQCAAGTTWRFLCCIQSSGPSGSMTLGPGVVGSSGGLIDSGETWHFQAWHRDVSGSPCGSVANLTNRYSVTFLP